MQEDFSKAYPVEGVPCMICGKETVNPILEVIDMTSGGDHVGYLCSDCSIKSQQLRTDKQ